MAIPNRPKITDSETDKIANYFFPEGLPVLLVIGVRGYFKKSVGKASDNDLNLWDDAVIVYEDGTLVKTFNGNTDPSKAKANLAMLDTGVYQFYKGTHKNRIKAFRAYPEGVRLKCKRQNSKGVWFESLCSAINFHDGGTKDTWSAGCQTIINQGTQKQFDEFRDLVYEIMTKRKLKTFTYLLIDENQMQTALEGKASEKVSEEIEIAVNLQKDSAAAPAIKPQTDSSLDDRIQSSESPAAVENSEIVSNQTATEPPPIQQTAENITNVTTGEQSSVPDNFVPEDKTVNAPPATGLKEKIKNWWIWLGLAPPGAAGIFASIKDYASDGTINFGEVLQLVLKIFTFVFPYIIYLLIAYVVYQIIKTALQQIVLAVQIYVNGRGDFNNVEIVPQRAEQTEEKPKPFYKKIFNL